MTDHSYHPQVSKVERDSSLVGLHSYLSFNNSFLTDWTQRSIPGKMERKSTGTILACLFFTSQPTLNRKIIKILRNIFLKLLRWQFYCNILHSLCPCLYYITEAKTCYKNACYREQHLFTFIQLSLNVYNMDNVKIIVLHNVTETL